MTLTGIFRFELGYQLRRAWPWLISAVLFVFAFLMTRDATLAEALYEDFFFNSPFAIAKTTVTGSLIWLLVAAAVAGEAGARDVASGMYPLTYTSSVRKMDYLGGRFLAAFVLNAIILLAVQAGILLAVYAPGVDAQLRGPFRPAAYLTSYAFLALPTAFVATAVQFSVAARRGRPMSAYLGSVLLFFLGFFIAGGLLFGQPLGKMVDPIGIRFVVDDLSHDWTTVEKSWRLVELEGTVLRNRLLWTGIGVAAFALTVLRFRFAHRAERERRRRRWLFFGRRRAAVGDARSPVPAGFGLTAAAPVAVPRVARRFDAAIQARQTLAVARASFRTLATSWAGLGLLVFIPLLTIPVVIDQMEVNGVRMVPTTAQVLGELTAPLSAELSRWVIVPLLIVFFAGELVWREREAGLGELADSMPGSEWTPLLGKFLGMGLVLALFTAVLTVAGILAQAMMGYAEFEIGLYLKVLFGLQLPEYLLFALLALVVHVVVDQKYVGHLVAIVAYVVIVMAPLFGIEHNLLTYGAGPGWSYSEMRGFGPSLGPWLWFKLYWAAWAVLLAVVARLLWVRGREGGPGVRLRWARRRFTRSTVGVATVAAGLVLTLGGFIFYNTNVRNEYLDDAAATARRAEYERRYGRFEDVPQPALAAAALRVEIHPERRSADVRGSYRLVNRGAVAIDSIHVATVPEVRTGEVRFDRPAARVLADDRLGHRIYALRTPLAPGDSLRLDFTVHAAPNGFRESGTDASVVENGTYFTNAWLPAIGYQASREIVSFGDRREHGLPARPVIPRLSDARARSGQARGIAFEAVVGTEMDQVAVAPGALRRTWTEGGRRWFHYASDVPIGGEWAFLSARYSVHQAEWRNPDGSGQTVAIRIYHHPEHTAHLDRMVRSIRASLDYYTRHFGPYPRGYLTVAERPGGGTGVHAEAGMLTYAEGFSLWNPGEGALDLPFAVMAHEVAHQWTVPYAAVEGAPVMSESVAWYYAMKAVEAARGEAELRRLREFMRQPQPYAPIRRGEPLLRGLDPYLSYRKGPFALYALSEYVGEERVNGALRSLLARHRAEGAPLATTLDLYRELQAVTPDSLRYLLHDLFEVNTYWGLVTERATAVQAPDSTWRVTLTVRARKVVADSAGVEREVPMDEWVPVGVFGPAKAGDQVGDPLYVRMHRIRSGRQTITVTVPRQPVLAGIDPYHLLEWEARETDDNLDAVRVEGAPPPAR